MNNQRGISITKILSKFLERIIHTSNIRNVRKWISEHKNGSMEKRNIYDNLFTLQAVIDDNKDHKKDTYILFANTEKCFGRLCLNDACNELNKIVFHEEDELIRKMNSNLIVAIDTPVGYTNEITLHSIVKQGTIMGSILCIVETGKINYIVERCYAIYGPEIRMSNLLCMT